MENKYFIIFIIALSALGGALWLLTQKQSTVPATNTLPTQQTTMQETNTQQTIATLSTTLGDIQIRLYTETMPVTTENFSQLIASGFYDNTAFHRIIPGFMIQGGDPLTKDAGMKARWGTGGPGYAIADEFNASNSNVRGTIAMANSGPNTGGSQFFINVADNTFLAPKHPVFGEVISGMEVVDAIVALPRNERDVPDELPVITKATVQQQ